MSKQTPSLLSVSDPPDEVSEFVQSGKPCLYTDVFIDALTHLLVICTSTKITVLGLGRENGSNAISLFSTNLSTTSTTPITYIAGSKSGRVFMLGETKELFELEYSNDSSWFFGSGAKIAIKNLSSGYLSNLLPTFLSSGCK